MLPKKSNYETYIPIANITTGEKSSKSNNNNSNNNFSSQENIFEEDDVQRFDAETYRQKYGDRWKKLATSVRDVVQTDGTIIREYVIEDPALLEQLSEDDENYSYKNSSNLKDNSNYSIENKHNISSSNESNNNSKSTNNNTTIVDKSFSSLQSNKNIQKSCINFSNEFIKTNKYDPKSILQNINTNNGNSNQSNTSNSSNHLNYNAASATFEINQSPQKLNSSTYNLSEKSKIEYLASNYLMSNNNNNTNMSNATASNANNNSNNTSANANQNVFQPINDRLKSPINDHSNSINVKVIKEEDDVDKEVEIIHEQGKQLKQLTNSYETNEIDNSVIEYEVLDEHGNQIMISGADQLKKLAACVNEIKQPDGSIVKEYILNDPRVIEQIRNQMKCKIQASTTSSSNQKTETTTTTANQTSNLYSNLNLAKYQSYETYKLSNNINNKTETNEKISSSTKNSTSPLSSKPLSASNYSSNKYQIENSNKYQTNEQLYEQISIEKKSSNDNLDRYSPLPSLSSTIKPTTPYVSQVQQQIQKFQNKQHQHQHQQQLQASTEQLYSSQQSILKKTTEPQSVYSKQTTIKPDVLTSNINHQNNLYYNQSQLRQTEQEIEDNFKQINRNMFELKTSKGKALKFTITSDDTTESDIEEVRSFLNKRIDKFGGYSTSPVNKSTTSSSKDQNLSYYYNSSSSNNNSKLSEQTTKSSNYVFQPKPLSNNNSTNQSNQNILKSGSMDNILNSSTSKTQQNENYYRLNSNKANIPVYLSYLNHAKSIANLNTIDSKNAYNYNYAAKAKSTQNLVDITSSYQNDIKKISPTTYIENQNSNYYETILSDCKNENSENTYGKLSSNSDKKINIESNESIKNGLSQNQIPKINNNTYTKSTFNFNYLPIENANLATQKNLNNKQLTPNRNITYQRENNLESSSSKKVNKSLDSLDKIENNVEITPEMTEKLLLKLLLHQISLQKQHSEDGDDEQTSFSNDTISNSSSNQVKGKPPQYVQSHSQFASSPIGSYYGSSSTATCNTVKNKLYQKSMSHFDRMEETETEYEEYEEKFQRSKNTKYQNSHKKAYKNYF